MLALEHKVRVVILIMSRGVSRFQSSTDQIKQIIIAYDSSEHGHAFYSFSLSEWPCTTFSISSQFMGEQSQSRDLEIRLRLIGDYPSVAVIASYYGATVDNVKVSSSQTSNLKSLRY